MTWLIMLLAIAIGALTIACSDSDGIDWRAVERNVEEAVSDLSRAIDEVEGDSTLVIVVRNLEGTAVHLDSALYYLEGGNAPATD